MHPSQNQLVHAEDLMREHSGSWCNLETLTLTPSRENLTNSHHEALPGTVPRPKESP